MGFGVGFRSPFEAHTNADDRRAAENVKTQADVQKLETQAGQEHALGRGSLGRAIGAGKSIGDTLGSALGGMSALTGHAKGEVGGAYEDSGVHAGKDPISG